MPKPIGYELAPIYMETREDVQLSAEAVVCAMTGEILAGSGGGGVYVSPRVARAMARGELMLDGVLEDDADKPDPLGTKL